jgi:hypothetical protein
MAVKGFDCVGRKTSTQQPNKTKPMKTTLTQEKLDLYKNAINDALMYMENDCDLEPTSALKQAGSDHGIEDGKEMFQFVTFANKALFN